MADGIARAGWDMDLAHGEARESAFVEALRGCRVEHKSDGWAPATGNVAIEYEQHGRASGIAVTEAEWWALEVQDDVWIVVRTSLLKIAARKAIRDGKIKMCGDQNAYRNALVPVDWLLRGVPAARQGAA